MYTIHIDENSTENIEIWVAGHRRITLSLSSKNTSLQIPGGVSEGSARFSDGSFFARTRDYN